MQTAQVVQQVARFAPFVAVVGELVSGDDGVEPEVAAAGITGNRFLVKAVVLPSSEAMTIERGRLQAEASSFY